MKVRARSSRRDMGPGPGITRPNRGKRFTRRSVTKMLAVMSEQSPDANKDPVKEFLTTGRTGRRNALPDIRGEHASVSTGDLPEFLKTLSTSDETQDAASCPSGGSKDTDSTTTSEACLSEKASSGQAGSSSGDAGGTGSS